VSGLVVRGETAISILDLDGCFCRVTGAWVCLLRFGFAPLVAWAARILGSLLSICMSTALYRAARGKAYGFGAAT